MSLADAEAEERAAERAEEERLVREADEKLRRRRELQGAMLHVNPPLVARGGPDSPKAWWVGCGKVRTGVESVGAVPLHQGSDAACQTPFGGWGGPHRPKAWWVGCGKV